jgi:hypothetical protein
MFKTLPSMEHTFTIDIEGTETRQKFQGTFTYRKPNLRVKSEIARTLALLNGGLANLDEDAILLHNILSTLKHTITDSPEWWKKADFGFELYDLNVVFDVYRACSDFESKWMKQVWADETKEESKKEVPKQ